MSWLGKAVMDGLVHCACTHHSVHPDLLTLATGDTEATGPHGLASADEPDSGAT